MALLLRSSIVAVQVLKSTRIDNRRIIDFPADFSSRDRRVRLAISWLKWSGKRRIRRQCWIDIPSSLRIRGRLGLVADTLIVKRGRWHVIESCTLWICVGDISAWHRIHSSEREEEEGRRATDDNERSAVRDQMCLYLVFFAFLYLSRGDIFPVLVAYLPSVYRIRRQISPSEANQNKSNSCLSTAVHAHGIEAVAAAACCVIVGDKKNQRDRITIDFSRFFPVRIEKQEFYRTLHRRWYSQSESVVSTVRGGRERERLEF